ncbi:hypothetical protein PR048_009746 [Dryococelus australis]|uniref:Gag-like protein n=1 Tax=Dryococelus australis TaxID=614101 RepID=A0ABQ9I0T6_9NEOP|nr:hypothetical protein PR048_009746 [Dryococelus australis]
MSSTLGASMSLTNICIDTDTVTPHANNSITNTRNNDETFSTPCANNTAIKTPNKENTEKQCTSATDNITRNEINKRKASSPLEHSHIQIQDCNHLIVDTPGETPTAESQSLTVSEQNNMESTNSAVDATSTNQTGLNTLQHASKPFRSAPITVLHNNANPCHKMYDQLRNNNVSFLAKNADRGNEDIPNTLKTVLGLRVRVVPYKHLNGPLQCSNCYRFGHVTVQCRFQTVCPHCSGPHRNKAAPWRPTPARELQPPPPHEGNDWKNRSGWQTVGQRGRAMHEAGLQY